MAETSATEVYEVPSNFQNALINEEKYQQMYQESVENSESFWAKQAERMHWFKKWDKVKEVDFNTASIKWYLGGKINVSYNCLDRHLDSPRKNQAALIWESDDPTKCRTYTYQQLHREVCSFANVLKKHGVQKGDRVVLYMPMIPELPIAMLACTRIGAVHSIVFGGFSADALRNRIDDCAPAVVVTADGGFRGNKAVPLKPNCDQAMEGFDYIKSCIVVNHSGTTVEMNSNRDHWWHTEINGDDISSVCPAEEMDSEDPLFILYTSGSTGKPKGVMHTTGGYITYASMTHKYVFDYRDGETYWCTADIGWVTGHSYIIYGPLANGASSVMYEGVPNYPDWGRFWDVVEKHQVNIFYTAPTAIRAIAKEGDDFVNKRDLSSLRLLGTVGEPINPEERQWNHRVVGKERCPIATKLKPGSATKPFFGVQPVIVDPQTGTELEGATEGALCIKDSWPGQMRGVYGDPERFFNTYFVQYKGMYFTGDGARRDEDGYYWITGRIDDVINVSGHRMGTAEVESALVLHHDVAEAAVVGFPHVIKGQGIYAYVTLNSGVEPTDTLRTDLVKLVRKEIGPIATIDAIQWAPGLPKTRSGKIMRRILRKIAENQASSIGDTSTLADPSVVENLIENRISTEK